MKCSTSSLCKLDYADNKKRQQFAGVLFIYLGITCFRLSNLEPLRGGL